MLRRRKKQQKDERRPHGGRGGTPGGSRRRARPDAFVPPELRLDAAKPEPAPAAPAPKAQAQADRGHEAAAGREAVAKERRRKPHGGRPNVVLLTGFDPFGGEQLNPSWEICRQLDGEVIEGARIVACKAPCEFRRSIETVAGAIREHQPRIVLSIGQAGGRAQMSVERIAINIDDARNPDNAGASPVDEAIAPSGPAAYFATLPVKAMTVAMREAGVPAVVSNSAGTYVCNHLMYGVLHFIAASGSAARAGFIHVPYAEEQVLDKPDMAAMSLASMVRGVRAAIRAALTHAEDLKIAEGTLD